MELGCTDCFAFISRTIKKFTGEVFLMYIAGYGLGRLWIEGLRTDQLLIPGIGFPVSQLLSAVLVIAAAGLIIYAEEKLRERGLDMATIQEIAEKAGVSRGTVDRALNNRGRINPQVAEKIRQTC